MKVEEVMTKDVASVSPSAGIAEIYKFFKERGVGALPVVNSDNKPVGIITLTELLDIFLPDYFSMLNGLLFIDDFGALEDSFESPPILELFIAEDLMNPDVITINYEASLLKAPALMNRYNVKRLVVVDEEGVVVGMLTRRNICRAFFER